MINKDTGRPEYRAEYFEADNLVEAHKIAMSKLNNRDEYLYELRDRKVQD